MRPVCRSIAALLIIGVLTLQSLAIAVPARQATAVVESAPLLSDGVVISQVYGAGGNAGASHRNDYIELFNRGTTTVSLSGWSVQYASATGTGFFSGNTPTPLTGSIAPGQYYLVQEAGGATGAVMPTPDATGTINMSGTAGKVILANTTTGLTCNGSAGQPCSPAQLAQIVDLVGYGTANFFEGAGPAPALTVTTAAFRGGNGCNETDNNSADFAAAASAPRNTASPTAPCSGPTNPTGVGAANPSTVAAGANTLLTVAVTNGTNPTSTGVTVTGDLSLIGGSASQQFFDDGTNGDASAGDNVFSFGATVAVATTAGLKSLPTTINDAQGRTGSANISLTVTSASTPPSGTGTATPSTVTAGNSTLLTVAVVGGSNPASTGLTVTADLSSIGGSASQSFFDDGSNGDTTAGDNTFSYTATVALATTPGAKNLPATIGDAEGRSGNTNISLTVNAAPPTGQPLPFAQSWTDTSQITTNNVWSGVPGIIGYLGDYSASSDTGVDPQSLLSDFSTTAISVLANQTDPNPLTSGGVAEFELANPVVAFQGSGTADAPHIVISVNATGASNVAVSYILRDVDSSSDNSVQPVALQYRIGGSGNYTNVPSAFVADASDGPSSATRVTPVGVILPADVNNQPLVQLRIITTNAVGSDEWIGIDNISVESNGTIPLSAVGAAAPANVEAGTSSRLTVTVNPATNPTSTGITVVGDLTAIGGSVTQPFYDDGTNGDVTPADNVFSFMALVPANIPSGSKLLPVSITDAQARNANASIKLLVSPTSDPGIHLTMGNPSGATTDETNPTNYLLSKSQYVMSYHRDNGRANWVSWHLDSSWIGSAPRQDDFRADPSLPAGWYQVTEFDYSGSGFDRGHNTPSADRTNTIPNNSATFLMTNIMPQAPNNNQGPWEDMESFARTVANQGNELYIVSGGAGLGGIGANGYATTIANGHVTVPGYTWKVMIILPSGDNDVSRVTTATRTIAVIMPNKQGIMTDPWQKYLATVDQVEALTGYDFFSNVSPGIQDVIESQLDAASNTNPQTLPGGTFTDLSIDAPNTTLTGSVTVNGNLVLGGSTLFTGGNKIILGPNATVTRLSGMVNGNVEKQFTSLASPTFEFPVGTMNGYSPVDIELTALNTIPSSLTVKATQGAHPNAPNPSVALLRYWSITENGDLTANLTFNYLDIDQPPSVASESTFDLHKFEGGVFTEMPDTLNIKLNTVSTNGISDFSDWTMFGDLAPTAANATVAGRVTAPGGVGVSGARVTLTDAQGNVFRAISNPFGYYAIEGVPPGQVYLAAVASRRYVFELQTISIIDSVFDMDFEALP